MKEDHRPSVFQPDTVLQDFSEIGNVKESIEYILESI
jgi:hypothetical protein